MFYCSDVSAQESTRSDEIKRQQDILNISDFIKEINHTNVDDKRNISEHLDNIVEITEECKLEISEKSKYVFQTTLKKTKPHFVQFHINIHGGHVNKTSDVFQPGRWYWTHGGPTSTPYQFLSWTIEYGLYSFGLLDYKTALVPYVDLLVDGHCNLTLGTEDTSKLITNALIPVITFDAGPDQPIKYKESYYCYLAVREELINTVRYYASVYILYPIILISYKCCFVLYNFTTGTFGSDCSKEFSEFAEWTDVYIINMILGFIITAYSPLILFKIFVWFCRYDNLTDNDIDKGNEHGNLINESDEEVRILHENWMFANGNASFTFVDALNYQVSGLKKQRPIFISRLRRLIYLLLAPSMIYIKLYMYSRGIGVWKESDRITITDLVDVGMPFAFMTFLASTSNRNKVFAPAFGGPVGLSIAYFALGFIYIVLPKYFVKIMDNGLPNSDILATYANSNVENGGTSSFHKPKTTPLYFGTKDIILLSQINVNSDDLKPGSTKYVTVMRCSFYMLFTKTFWRQVLQIQIERISYILNRMPQFVCFLGVVFFPIYIVVCVIETMICILYFGLPFVFIFVSMLRSAMTMIPYLRENYKMFSYFFSIRYTRCLGNITIFISILLFAYCIFLLIVTSFKFITVLITYCFLAILLYPSNSFGRVFLSVIIIYYILRQLKNFSYIYSRLFLTAVAISKRISETHNHVTCSDGHLFISNTVFEEIGELQMNGRQIHFAQNLTIRPGNIIKVKVKDKCFGIPQELFDLLIQKFRPVHKYILLLLLRVIILISCVILFLYIMHAWTLVPEHQLSEVMHVLLVIVVGAIPKLIESDVIGHSNASREKIEKKYIEQCIIEFWTRRYDNN